MLVNLSILDERRVIGMLEHVVPVARDWTDGIDSPYDWETRYCRDDNGNAWAAM